MAEKNAVANMLSALVSGLSLFIVYRIAFQILGTETIGAWALLSGLMTLARIGEAGVGAGILRLVAIDTRAGAQANVWRYISAGLLIASIPTTLTAAIGGVIGYLYLLAAHRAALPEGDLRILGISAWLFAVFNSIGSVLAGCLDGAGQMFYRTIWSTIAILALAAMVWALTPRFGLIGFGGANVGYGIIYCLGLMAATIRSRPAAVGQTSVSITDLVRRARSVVLGGFAIGACRATFDPMCKFLIGVFGDLSAVAIFDFANRISLQLRTLFASGVQALAPSVARGDEEHVPSTKLSLSEWWAVTYSLSGLAGVALIGVSPCLSALTFKQIDTSFIVYLSILALGGWINAAGLVGFYVEMGKGQMKGLLQMHVVMAAINLIAGVSLGFVFGPQGVVAAWALALGFGGIFLFYRSDWSTNLGEGRPGFAVLRARLINYQSTAVIIAGVCLAALFCSIGPAHPKGAIALSLLVTTATGCVSAYVLWRRVKPRVPVREEVADVH